MTDKEHVCTTHETDAGTTFRLHAEPGAMNDPRLREAMEAIVETVREKHLGPMPGPDKWVKRWLPESQLARCRTKDGIFQYVTDDGSAIEYKPLGDSSKGGPVLVRDCDEWPK